jgi:3-oxoacyl-(acyl-carrier-protein) synthase
VNPRCLGIGAATPHGLAGGAALRATVRAGVLAPADDDGAVRVSVAVTEEAEEVCGARGWRRMSVSSRLACTALTLAARDAGLDPTELAGPETALVLSTRFGCLSLFESFHRALCDEGPRAVSPTVFTTGVLNAPTGHGSLEHKLRGPTHTLVGGEAAGFEALAIAAEILEAGGARHAFVVGVEEAAPLLLEGLAAGRARPAARVVGEGAVAILLEADATRGPELTAICLGRPGRAHGAEASHRALIDETLAAAGVVAGTLAESWRVGLGGADGGREAAACAGLPNLQAVAPALGYAPACASLAAVACAALAPAGAALATAQGGPASAGACVWRPA